MNVMHISSKGKVITSNKCSDKCVINQWQINMCTYVNVEIHSNCAFFINKTNELTNTAA